MEHIRSILGIFFILAVAYLLSNNRKKISLRVIFWGLGLQLFFESSQEGTSARGLGLLEGEVVRFPRRVRIPHMGWNQLRFPCPHPIFAGLDQDTYVYFVHSYYPRLNDSSATAATTTYGIRFASAVARGNLLGVQFHPEKSQATGLKILANFLRLTRRTKSSTP